MVTKDIFDFSRWLLTLAIAVLLFAHPLMADPAGLPIRGVVRPLNSADISTDIASRIVKLPFTEGEEFAKGDTLVEFDCDRFEAERKALSAEAKVHQLTFENNETLREHNAIGKFDVDISAAKLAKARAEIKRLDVRIGKCKILAPYNGRIEKQLLHEYETPQAGKPIISIIESGALEIRIIVPSSWLSWLDKGTGFSFRVDETGITYEASVKIIGAAVDPVSQTIEVRASFDSDARGVLAGMSGAAIFSQPQG